MCVVGTGIRILGSSQFHFTSHFQVRLITVRSLLHSDFSLQNQHEFLAGLEDAAHADAQSAADDSPQDATSSGVDDATYTYIDDEAYADSSRPTHTKSRHETNPTDDEANPGEQIDRS